jgi:hypothetical protein
MVMSSSSLHQCNPVGMTGARFVTIAAREENVI